MGLVRFGHDFEIVLGGGPPRLPQATHIPQDLDFAVLILELFWEDAQGHTARKGVRETHPPIWFGVPHLFWCTGLV